MAPNAFRLTKTTEEVKFFPAGCYFKESDPAVGHHFLDNSTLDRLTNSPELNHEVVAGLMDKRMGGERRVAVISDGSFPTDDPGRNWYVSLDELLSNFPRNPSELLDRALMNLSRMSPTLGAPICLTENQRFLVYAKDPAQEAWVLRQLVDLGYIREEDAGSHASPASYSIRAEGWRQIGELLRKPRASKPEAFLAMNFAPDMDPFYRRGFMPAIQADGKTKCVRIDYVQHNNKICDEIIAAIRRCRYVVADFTGNRGGVYYEAGFAHGLGLPVIWTVRASTAELHFDTRQYNHIVYDTPEQLQELLRLRIAATIT